MSASFSRPKPSGNGDFPASVETAKYAEYAKQKSGSEWLPLESCSVCLRVLRLFNSPRR